MFHRIESRLLRTNPSKFESARILVTGASGVVGQPLFVSLAFVLIQSTRTYSCLSQRELMAIK